MSFRRSEVGEAPVRVLSATTRQLMAARLDSRKILLAQGGIHRDWRGVAEQANLDTESISCWGKISPSEHCLHIMGQRGGSIKQLWGHLEAMDRFDVIDDTLDMIYNDYDKCVSQGGGSLAALPPPMEQMVSDMAIYDANILTVDDQRNISQGGGLQHYTALVLFADEDLDFVQEMVEKLEGEYGIKLCLKDRDLVGGLQFESNSIVRLIVERCTRVVVVLSPEFLASNANNFFINFAQALSIEHRRRIVIPCLYKPCVKPPIISFCHSLDYYRAKGYWNYWEKLRDSLVYQPHALASGESRARIRAVSGSSSSSQVSASSLSITTPSPIQSPSFFSKFLKRSDGKSKGKSGGNMLRDSSQGSQEESDQPEEEGQKSDVGSNGLPRSAAIPILQLGPSTGESRDHTATFPSLPDVPETPPGPSPMSTTSSAALLLPDTSPTSPRSPSKLFEKLFKGRQKKQKIPG